MKDLTPVLPVFGVLNFRVFVVQGSRPDLQFQTCPPQFLSFIMHNAPPIFPIF